MRNDKRQDYISWDGYFMGIAAIASFRSKDPNTQNGANIVDPVARVSLSVGYNGMPWGCDDDCFPWVRTAEKEIDKKYMYVEHAEKNAIFNAAKKGISLNGSVMYLYSERGYYPCCDCARAIIQSGIKKVIMAFVINENTDKYDWTATKRMFEAAEIECIIMDDFAKESLKMSDNFEDIGCLRHVKKIDAK